MPSVISHAVAGGSLARVLGPQGRKLLLLAAISAMVPDADALGYFAGVPYASMFGHRGFTHSLLFAVLWALLLVLLWFRHAPRRGWILVSLFVATASHPVLDMLTNGGMGVALWAPFSNARLFFPWRPIAVSPISVTGFFTARGWAVLKSELVWVWLPSLALAFAAHLLRRPRSEEPGA